MADLIATKKSNLVDIADAVRNKTGISGNMALSEIVTNINEIEATGGGSSEEEWIGDGNTHIWISLQEGRTSPMVGVGVKGTVTVDWGDGSTPSTLTGSYTDTIKYTPAHNYAEPGDYVITLSGGEIGIWGNLSGTSYLVLGSTSVYSSLNLVYSTSIKRLRQETT